MAITPQLARTIRTLHLIDRLSGSEIARRVDLTPSAVNKILRWEHHHNQDHDLRSIPKPHHPGGGFSRGPIRANASARPSCLDCIHITPDKHCSLEFPECRKSKYLEAKNCCCFIPLTPQPA